MVCYFESALSGRTVIAPFFHQALGSTRWLRALATTHLRAPPTQEVQPWARRSSNTFLVRAVSYNSFAFEVDFAG